MVPYNRATQARARLIGDHGSCRAQATIAVERQPGARMDTDHGFATALSTETVIEHCGQILAVRAAPLTRRS
jgi:hypothetical protein